MSIETPVAKKKIPVVKIALVLVVVAGLALLFLRGVNIKELIERGMTLIRDAGPVAFFGAMLILPALGLPLMAFTILAGEAFGSLLSVPGVIGVSLFVIALNLMLNYWLARFAFRPLLTGWVKRAGYSIPQVTPENALSVALVVRLVPGPPYALQGYLLGLAGVPFRTYMIVSWLCVSPWAIGAIILGKGILNGNFKVAAIGIGVIAIAVLAVQFWRQKYAKRGK
jgi:uncharacterized membrane protein YdjX (TVP38/TMEM64 family)